MAPPILCLDDVMAMANEDLEAMIATEIADKVATATAAEGNGGKAA